jgi:HSP20 family protein
MDVPGINPGEIGIAYDSGELTVTGQKSHLEGVRYLLKESLAGPFSRVFALPPVVNIDAISAEVKDGVLTIRAPKRDEARSRSIDLKVA